MAAWEWYERGIEYTLQRVAPELANAVGSASGTAKIAADIALTPTILRAVEVPQSATGNSSQRVIYAAATSSGSAWPGASLYVEQNGSLIPIGTSGSRRAVSGSLVTAMSSSQSLMVEPSSSLEVQLPASDLSFEDTNIAGLASGANQLLVGAEVMQFMHAESIGGNRWRLSGLLRGRAGTEDYALGGHAIGTDITLLDNRITSLDPALVPVDQSTRIAAIGPADTEAAITEFQNPGLSFRPPAPVHPRTSTESDGTKTYCWARRARGAWRWDNSVETPLVEEQELYLIGYGPVAKPHSTWNSQAHTFSLSGTVRDQLVADFGLGDLWVKQIGTYALSPALLLDTLA